MTLCPQDKQSEHLAEAPDNTPVSPTDIMVCPDSPVSLPDW